MSIRTIIYRPIAGVPLLWFLFFLPLSGSCQADTVRYHFSVHRASARATVGKLGATTKHKMYWQPESLQAGSPYTYQGYNTLAGHLQALFGGLPVAIYIRGREVYIDPLALHSFVVKVYNEEGDPMAHVSVRNLVTGRYSLTQADGAARLHDAHDSLLLALSHAGYLPDTVTIRDTLPVQLHKDSSVLGEALETGYGKNSPRFSVGNAGHVSARNMVGQPYSQASDLLRIVPGLKVANITDIGWGAVTMETRGSRTIQPVSPGRRTDEPLVVIDGVPCLTCTGTLNQLSSVVGDPQGLGAGSNALGFLNAADIESVVVLKDATATAIYGGRAANGVVLITLRKPLAGQPRLQVSLTCGVVDAYRVIPVLNPAQYLTLLRAGIDTLSLPEDRWTSLSPINWPSYLYGQRGPTTNAQVSATGGNGLVRWRVGGNYQRQEYVYPGTTYDQWARLSGGVHLRSRSNRFHMSLTSLYSLGDQASPGGDLRHLAFLPPYLPPLRLATGALNWSFNYVPFANPLGWLATAFTAQSNHTLAHGRLDYRLTAAVRLSLDLGVSSQRLREKAVYPIAAQAPDTAARGSLARALRRVFAWIAEPQVDVHLYLGRAETKVLLGTSLQAMRERSWATETADHTSDLLLHAVAGQPFPDSAGPLIHYKLHSVFGRVHLNLDKQYLLELTGRIDASSRFAAAHRRGHFGAAGGSWVFSNARWLCGDSNKVLSFGKLGLTYGFTGSDQVADYAYYNQYIPSGVDQPYGPFTGLKQTRPGNTALQWQGTTKAEMTAALEFWHWLYVQAVYYRHRSHDQVMQLPLAAQSGFSTVDQWNYPAVVLNRGWEFSLTAKTSFFRTFQLRVSAHYTLPRNQLLSFPAGNSVLPTHNLLVGHPLSAVATRRLTGIDAGTGLFTSAAGGVIKDLEVQGFGSLQLTLEKRPWSLGIILEGRRQPGYSSRFYTYNRSYPGERDPAGFPNQPASVLDRWPSGTLYQRASATPTSLELAARDGALDSEQFYTDQSYVCVRHLALQYQLPHCWLKRLRVTEARISLQGQNLWTISPYREGNPMVQQPYALPVTRFVSACIQVTF